LFTVLEQNSVVNYQAITRKGKRRAAEQRARAEEARQSIESLGKEISVLEAQVIARTAGIVELDSIKPPEIIDLTCDDESEPLPE
jgi:hypothetical protein